MFRPVEDQALDGALRSAIGRVLDSRWFILGESVARFEDAFARYCGVNHCVGVANGTDALELALKACGTLREDLVVVVANAGGYSTSAVHACGATPVYVDVDKNTLTMSPISLRSTLDSLCVTPRAIVVTHLYGLMADVDTVGQIAKERSIPLIEDCAQAHGATRKGVKAGAVGDMGCFSFYPTKNLGAVGDGGAVVTNDADLAASVKQLRQYGWSGKYRVDRLGGRNSRLDEIQAAVLEAKLPMLDHWNRQRRDVAELYCRRLGNLGLRLPACIDDSYVAHLFVLRSGTRELIRQQLSDNGVASDIHYPIPDHLQHAHRGDISLPETERACSEVLSLPCFPGLTGVEVDRVVRAIEGACSVGS